MNSLRNAIDQESRTFSAWIEKLETEIQELESHKKSIQEKLNGLRDLLEGRVFENPLLANIEVELARLSEDLEQFLVRIRGKRRLLQEILRVANNAARGDGPISFRLVRGASQEFHNLVGLGLNLNDYRYQQRYSFTYEQEIGADSTSPHHPTMGSGVTIGPGYECEGSR